MTSNAFRAPFNLGDPIGATHYDQQYYAKTTEKEEPIRSGTSSGNRCHKPHPLKVLYFFLFFIF